VRIKIISLMIALFCLSFVFGAMAIITNAELTDATVKSYEEQIANVAWQIEQAKQKLNDIRNQQSATWVEIGAIDELIKYNDELKALAEQQLNSLTLQIEEAKASIADTEAKIEAQEAAFLERMAHNYMEQDVDYIELVFQAEDLVDFLTRLDRVNAILDYDKKVIADLKENREQLEIVKAKLDEAEKTQMLRVAEYEKVIKDNQAIYQEKLDFIDYLKNNESAAQANYEYYQKLDDELNKKLEEYLAELQRKSQSQYVGGNGGWPLEPGVYYYVSSEQGWRNLWGTQNYHYGIDLACANGTKILSYNAGTVIVSTFHYSYGNYVVVDHGGGISTLYAHMSSNAVAVGDYVQAGQLLGYCGLTGNTSGYHLHFEYRINGQVQNPRNYLVFP